MGNLCTSSHIIRKGKGLNWPSTAKVIHLDGRLQEFMESIKASHILSQNPNFFLCSLESMYVDSHAPHVPIDEELQLGQIYFLIPTSKSHVPLSLQDLCSLAIKASTALQNTSTKIIPAGPERCCSVLPGFEVVGINSQAARGSRRIEFYD